MAPSRTLFRTVPVSNENTTKSYEGKAKRITVLQDQTVEVFFKDDATAFNGTKHAQIAGKGAINSAISALLFDHLKRVGVPHHFIRRQDDRIHICHHASMFAVEVIVRFAVAGSLEKRTGLPSGSKCEPPVIEFYYKRDDLGDPIINHDHMRLLKLAQPEEITTFSALALKAAVALRKLCASVDMDLLDIKFEFGRTAQGIVLADEISPDTCRLHDRATGRVLDKDIFRRELGDLMDGYREVHKRLAGAIGEVTRV